MKILKTKNWSDRIGKHSRICSRFAEAVFVLFLIAFLLTTLPAFIWMLQAENDLSSQDSSQSGERLISTQIQPLPVYKAVFELKEQVFKPIVEKPFLQRPPNAQQGRETSAIRLKRGNDLSAVLGHGDGDDDSFQSLGLSNIKVFVYDLPSKYNLDWLADGRCNSHLFAAEVAIHRNLLSSSVRTLNPDEADYFFMPVYVSCNFSLKTGFPILTRATEILESAVSLVSETMPYWNRSQGADHVFVATHDFGACFHAMEDLAVSMGIPQFLRASIILQTFGQKSAHPCQGVDHIQIPPYVVPDGNWPDPRPHKRNIFAFFRGKMEIHPKNVSGHMYSRGVRTVIWRRFSHDRRFFIKRKRSEKYREEMLRSVFCLCPLGWAPWSPRIVESVIYGCVPVIIADDIKLPYSHVINWNQISVTVPEKDVRRLDKILHRVAATNLSMIQSNLWRDEVRKALVFNQPLSKGDATWQILDLLARKKSRVHKSRALAFR